ncbi:MAG: hypothetical protein ILP10_02010, partial [Lachnospiraceae bacterium]|nr:hypothetical protein [Lachnospiraceae bacterium]
MRKEIGEKIAVLVGCVLALLIVAFVADERSDAGIFTGRSVTGVDPSSVVGAPAVRANAASGEAATLTPDPSSGGAVVISPEPSTGGAVTITPDPEPTTGGAVTVTPTPT